MKSLLFIIFCAVATIAATFPNIKIGDSSPINTKALLEVNSTAKGVLIPRMTTTQRNAISTVISTIPLGLLVYDTTIDSTCQRITSSWACLPPMSTSSFPFIPNRLLITSTIGSTVVMMSTAGTSGQFLKSNGISAPPSFANAPVTAWTAYTPSFNNNTATSNVDFIWRQDGSDSIDIQGRVTFAGGVNGGELQISLPPGLTVNSTLVANQRSFGDLSIELNAGDSYLPSANGGNSYFVIFIQVSNANLTGTGAAGASFTFHISGLPVTGL